MSRQINFFASEHEVAQIAERIWEKLYPIVLVSECTATPKPEFFSVDNSGDLAAVLLAETCYLIPEKAIADVRMGEQARRGFPLDRHSTEMMESSAAGMIDAETARCGRLYLYGDPRSPFGKAFVSVAGFIRRNSVPYSKDKGFRVLPDVANKAQFLMFHASSTRKPFNRS